MKNFLRPALVEVSKKLFGKVELLKSESQEIWWECLFWVGHLPGSGQEVADVSKNHRRDERDLEAPSIGLPPEEAHECRGDDAREDDMCQGTP
jgi:hypothetical protein